MTTHIIPSGAPWHVVGDGDSHLYGIFPERKRARWFAKQCQMFAAKHPAVLACEVDIQVMQYEYPEDRWVHTTKRQPPDVENLQAKLQYAEQLLRAVANCPTPRFTEGSAQQRLDSAHAGARAYVEKYRE